jgi:hypothetical protein
MGSCRGPNGRYLAPGIVSWSARVDEAWNWQTHRIYFVLLISVSAILSGCVSASSGRNAACQWSGDAGGPLNLNDDRAARHLSEDAEKAEDLSIRYADRHSRPGHTPGATMADYHRVRLHCEATLFQAIADGHHVTPEQVRESINTHRRTSLDAVVTLSFGLLYAFIVNRFVRGIWLRFPPAEDRLHGMVATIVISPIASLLGVVIGEMWSGLAEALRIGYGHLVQRADRIPWGHHRPTIFVIGIALFWIFSWLRYREARSSPVELRNQCGKGARVIVDTTTSED